MVPLLLLLNQLGSIKRTAADQARSNRASRDEVVRVDATLESARAQQWSVAAAPSAAEVDFKIVSLAIIFTSIDRPGSRFGLGMLSDTTKSIVKRISKR
jgi:hypothetical protein